MIIKRDYRRTIPCSANTLSKIRCLHCRLMNPKNEINTQSCYSSASIVQDKGSVYDSLSKGFLYKVVINRKQQTSSNSCSLVQSNFSIEYRSSLKLHCFCFTSHCYWCRKLASLPRPIRCKSKTNHDLVARIFPRFRQFGSFYSEFSLALKILSFF